MTPYNCIERHTGEIMQSSVVVAVIGVVLCATGAWAEESVLKTQKDATSYALGVSTGRNFKSDGMDVDIDMYLRGIKDGMAGGTILISEKDLRRIIKVTQSEVRKRSVLSRRDMAEENRRKGEVFLAENRKKDGVTVLQSGVQYRVIKVGAGRSPSEGDTLECKYRGTLINGAEFSSSGDGDSALLKMSTLVPGLKEALKHMTVGSRWEIVVPARQAYGERGVGNDVGPNETLIYDVELVSVK